MPIFEHDAQFYHPVGDLYKWHAGHDAFVRLLPTWLNYKLRRKQSSLSEGSKLSLQISYGPFKRKWKAKIVRVIPNQLFEDVQLEGPFKYWSHEHLFVPNKSNPNQCTLKELIDYGPLKGIARFLISQDKIEENILNLMLYRDATLSNDLDELAKYNNLERKRILVVGSSGLVGKALVPFLRSQGHTVLRLLRRKSRGSEHLFWDYKRKKISLESLEGFDVVIHLGGTSVACRWTEERRQNIKQSRIQSTRFLVESLNLLKSPPKLFICASATGFYGTNPRKECTEESSSSADFLSDLASQWEKEAKRYTQGRVVSMRLSTVLSPQGGMLKRILPLFRLGLGGPLGNGEQKFSWIALDDVLYQVQNIIYDEKISGPVNFVSPEVVTNAEFTKTLAELLEKPAFFRVPRFAAKLAFGKMADDLLFSSSHIIPEKLKKHGHEFRFPILKQALRHMLGAYTKK